MVLLSALGIVLCTVFGCLLLALVGEIYYLLWWKKQRITSCNSSSSGNFNCNSIEENYTKHTKEMFYLFCWDKPNISTIAQPTLNSTPNTPNPVTNNHHDPDLETGFESVESELMRVHNLAGPPRFLFTIKEESKEDLESECGDKSRKGSRSKSLGDLILAIEESPPLKGSDLGHDMFSNPLFESSIEAELLRLKASPPPKFKFLRDAEEKLYRKLLEEAQKEGILGKSISDSSSLGLDRVISVV